MSGFTSIKDFSKAKEAKEPISMVTCYDYAFARLVEDSDIDTILVGDSLGMVQAGLESTIPVTVDQMIYHSQIVRRGAPTKFIVTDLPFMSYHVSIEDTMRNCGRVMKETGCNAVKLEGGVEFAPVITALVTASIPVVAHLGLTPQSVHKLGGYTVQGRAEDQKKKLISDAKAVQDAGAFALVLEMVPETVAHEITEMLEIPTIGIGAGRHTSGQVLVLNDMLGMNKGFDPKFLKKYANLAGTIEDALNSYSREVKEGIFPAEKNVFS